MYNNLLYCKDDDYDESDYIYSDEILNGESIIAFNVYDSCLYKECLDSNKIGPAKSIENICVGDKVYKKREAIAPPCDAYEVDFIDLRIGQINIKKKKSKKKKGFWDIQIRYTFFYKIIFRNKNKHIIGSVNVKSIYYQRVSLFGSACPSFSISTDIIKSNCDQDNTFKAVPFVMLKANAILLTPKISLHEQISHEPEKPQRSAYVTAILGLFSEVSLYRIVNLLVCSDGFCGTHNVETDAII